MTEAEYTEAVKFTKERHRKELEDLAIDYAKQNNPYKIGDIVKDHTGRVRVEKISVTNTYGNDTPSCVYYGAELKKNGDPKKNGSRRKVFQVNLEMGV